MRNKSFIAALAVTAAIGIACSSGGADTAGPGAQDTAADGSAAKKKSIVLEVTGAKKADITYGLNSDQSQDNGVKVPWKKTMSSGEAMIVATVLAQNKGAGTIKCRITVDGKVVKENASKGEYAVVTCTTDALT
ncbi:MmpS family transport accessory protein [Actinoplanes oblitus]|uniref:MmpS family transport accessory protein n=1 Tax=Actinoplanes oblitus TaxID=3040509 RepID=A0ABY8WSC7_9ACTN|nr:MmpS family transport accessory protein [Actinoplanes oblitus]WIN00368.1 MmpS family transport accessory protein [Actinoplanes oblitus]